MVKATETDVAAESDAKGGSTPVALSPFIVLSSSHRNVKLPQFEMFPLFEMFPQFEMFPLLETFRQFDMLPLSTTLPQPDVLPECSASTCCSISCHHRIPSKTEKNPLPRCLLAWLETTVSFRMGVCFSACRLAAWHRCKIGPSVGSCIKVAMISWT